MDDRPTSYASGQAPVALQLLDGFSLRRHGRRVDLPARAARLVACLAVRGGPVGRSSVAGHLWPEVTERQAGTSLRSTLLAVRRACPELLDTGPHHLGLAPAVAVDLVDLGRWCRAAIDPLAALPTAPPFSHCPALLPDVDDDWVATERDQLRQRVLHALESVTDRLLQEGRYGEASLAATCAVVSEPLRESARRALIRVHLAEGNLAEALVEYQRFEDLLERELGVPPTTRLTALVEAAVPGSRRA